MAQQRRPIGDLQGGVQQAAVPPMQLGALYQALADVAVVGWQTANQEGALQVVKVAVHGVVGERQALADSARIPLLALHSGQHGQQALGGLRRRGQSPSREVALGEQREVVRLPDGEAPTGFQHPAVRVATQQPTQATGRFGQFGQRQGRQLQQRQPAGQGFGHVPHQRRRNRAEQQETTVAFALGIDGASETRKQRRPSLGLIQDQKLSRIHQARPVQVKPQTLLLLLQVVVNAAQRTCQRGLAALAGAHQRHGGKLSQAMPEDGRDLAGNHRLVLQNRNQFLFCIWGGAMQSHHAPSRIWWRQRPVRTSDANHLPARSTGKTLKAVAPSAPNPSVDQGVDQDQTARQQPLRGPRQARRVHHGHKIALDEPA